MSTEKKTVPQSPPNTGANPLTPISATTFGGNNDNNPNESQLPEPPPRGG